MTPQQNADLALYEYQLDRTNREKALRAYVQSCMRHRPSEPVNPPVAGEIVNKEA